MKENIYALSALLLQAPLYADQARKATPQDAHDKPVPERALKVVTVKVTKDPKPS